MSDHPLDRIVRRRPITGISAVLLPYHDGRIDWDGFESLVARTVAAGLEPAVNMDTGFGALLTPAERDEVIDRTAAIAPAFCAGAYVDDAPGDLLSAARYLAAMNPIREAGGTPVVFPSYALSAAPETTLPRFFAELGDGVDRFIGFELGRMFLPTGRIFAPDTYRAWLGVEACIGAKHSSLDRGMELERLALRDAHRPDFKVFTGNDLAIDMVMFGSDYLLGLSAFHPEAFAVRDALWAVDDPRFFALNDVLQYLGRLAFRPPVPAYKHDAAQFLALRGVLRGDDVHPSAERRPATDREILRPLLDELDALVDAVR